MGSPSSKTTSKPAVRITDRDTALAVSVYQAPNTDAGFVDAFYRAAADNSADSVSASWGESASAVTPTPLPVFSPQRKSTRPLLLQWLFDFVNYGLREGGSVLATLRPR